MSHRSAPIDAASATAVVSEPPRPSVVISRVRLTPWNPATITTRPGYVVPSNLEVANSAAFAQTSRQPASSFVFNEAIRRAQTLPFSPAWPEVSEQVAPALNRMFYAPVIDLDSLLEVLKRRAFEHKRTPTIGRSHGIHAEPTTFGLKLAQAYAEFDRCRDRLGAGVRGGAARQTKSSQLHRTGDPPFRDRVREA